MHVPSLCGMYRGSRVPGTTTSLHAWTAALVFTLIVPICNANAASSDTGERIYRSGELPSGQSLTATRDDGMKVQGADSACINCHRRSGLGSREGRTTIPPITGQYLFHPHAARREEAYLPFVDGIRRDREPYTDATLARAIRDGINSEGKPLSYLMPHFDLNDADMAALISYLKQLDQRKSPGVSDTELHFATIITPDADPVKTEGMLAVLKQFFSDKNIMPIGPTPRLRSTVKIEFMANRYWQLHVWRLTGPADSWGKQLKRHFSEEPVLAVISGLGGENWTPIHEFCESEAVPCLFPNIEVPPAGADHDYYSVYFSKGVLLEAGLIANGIINSGSNKEVKVVQQIYRLGDSGEAGAKALASMLEPQGITVHNRVLAHAGHDKGVEESLRPSSEADAVVLWLRPSDIAALGDPPPASTAVFMSGLMGGLENAPIPGSWRERTHIAYPFDLPDKRRIGVDFAFGWFSIHHISVVSEQVQADTYLACGLLAETLSHMADTFNPDYLVERIEDSLDHRIITGYYPHLTLAPGQRFASKGGYLVHFSGDKGARVIADRQWLVP